VDDMKRLETWLYIIDPVQKRVFGIEKGKSSTVLDEKLRDEYVKNLPQPPIRTASQVVKISEYAFEEKHAYKAKSYRNYFFSENAAQRLMGNGIPEIPRYADIFQSLILLDSQSGLTYFSFQYTKLNEQMVSGFLSAMDSFVSVVSGESQLEEINYKGFIITAAMGERIKVVAILNKSGGIAFKERLHVLVSAFEKRFAPELALFYDTGDKTIQTPAAIEEFIKHILSI